MEDFVVRGFCRELTNDLRCHSQVEVINMAWQTRIFLAACFSVASFAEMGACTCASGGGPACEETWRESVDSIVLGRVLKIEPADRAMSAPAGAMSMTMMGGTNAVTVVVEEAYRGTQEKTVRLYTAASSAACGYPFQQGERYLVFASVTKDKKLIVSLCSATKPAKYADEDIGYLRSLPSLPPTATIMGSLWKYTHDPNFKPKFQPSIMDHFRPPEQEYVAMIPASGATVVVKGGDGTTHRSTVDSDGNWRIASLPPGYYFVEPQFDDTIFVHPFRRRVEVVSRGCAWSDIRIETNGRISGKLGHSTPEQDWALLKVFALPVEKPDLRHPSMEGTLESRQSEFEIAPLPAGQYILGGYLVKQVSVDNGYTFRDMAPTYFPGVTDVKLAAPIVVGEGKAVKGIVFTMLKTDYLPAMWRCEVCDDK